MKILVIQLARLGDIYQTWPVIRALKRLHGEGVLIDLLTRERFAGATLGLSEVNQVYSLDSKAILSPVICDEPRVQEAVDQISSFALSLRNNNYNRIINLSFSSFSSYLTEAICSAQTRVNGYSRFVDGFLNIPDEVSSYFFAQVGVGLSNRVHVTDLFAQTAEVELIERDYCKSTISIRKKQIIIHMGASSEFKRLSFAKWQSLLAALLADYSGTIQLIGSAEEAELGLQISLGLPSSRIINRIGKTSLEESMSLIAESELLVGGDSAPIHMAALTQTAVLNLSFESVNFWETGPKSKRSLVLKMKSESELTADLFIAAVDAILFDEAPPCNTISLDSNTGSYVSSQIESPTFGWELNMAIYMNGTLPYVSDFILRQALLRLHEANQLALEQIEILKADAKNKIALECFEQCDQIFSVIEKLSPEIGVLIRWIRVEKLRIPPGNYSDVLNCFYEVHTALDKLLNVYPLKNWNQLKNGVLNDKNILDEA